MAGEVLSLWGDAGRAAGREAELSTLLREHEESRAAERARFVFVRGPAGVGKSHLFGLLRQELASRGVPVFEGQSPREARRPFGLFSSMVEQISDHLAHAGVPSLKLTVLAQRLAPLRGAAAPSSGPVPNDGARLELYDALCELFALARPLAPAFLFPDLDAADLASLELVRYLAAVSTAPEAKVAGLFVASFRDEGALPPALADVVNKVGARSVPLSGLDVEGIRLYLSRRDVAERLLEATGGNPDALEQLFQRTAPRPTELFLRRVARVPPQQSEVLAVLAAAPGAIALEVLQTALGRAFGAREAALAPELDGLVRTHLVAVKWIDGTAVYRFTRESEKAAFAAELPVAELAKLQKSLGAALLDRGDPVAASELLLEVDPAGSGAAAAVLAADQLSARAAHSDAAELYQRALPHLPAGERGRVLRRLSEVLAAQGEYRRALRNLLASRRAGGGDEAELSNAAAHLLLKLGRPRLAEGLLELALKTEATRPGALVNKVEVRLLLGDSAGAISAAGEALPFLQEAGRVEDALAVRNLLGRAYLLRGEHGLAEECFARNAAVADEAGLPQLAALARVNQGVVAHQLGDREGAIRGYQAGVAAGDRPLQAKAFANLGSLYADAGDFEPALDHLSRALQALSRFGAHREVAHVASNLARLNYFLGDLDRAIELSEHALKRSREGGEKYLQASALLNLGATLIDRRELHEASRLLESARGLFDEVGNPGYSALASGFKARAHLLAGDRAQATAELGRRALDRALEKAGLPAAVVEVELTRAELCLALGDGQGAGRAASRAREALLAKPDLEGPYRVYFVLGRVREALGDAVGAQAELGRAGRMLDELTQRVPARRRDAFLAVPRRSEVLAAAEPELRLPRLHHPPSVIVAADTGAAHGLVGNGPSMRRLVKQLEPVGRSAATVLIRGESGTGKELLADALHRLSPRKSMPLVKVNCAAMVEELLLSELFGHEKGAFTGAVRERKGRFELADGGTLFLDEIGDISPKCQVALLRVLQEREFERVGGTRTLKVDVRVICATHRDLESMIAQGRFRQDLYYRLKGVTLELPSLRDRPEDLPLLSAHFLARLARERAEPMKRLSMEAQERLARHSWPGNVRELENVLASAAIFADGPTIGLEAFDHIPELALAEQPAPVRPAPLFMSAPVRPAPVAAAPVTTAVAAPSPVNQGLDDAALAGVDLSGPLDYYALARQRGISLKALRHEVEMQCIKQALTESGGNISEAARLLQMKRSRLSQIVNAEPELKGVAHGGDEEGI
jgi:transcriptional regulator with GAF, ATPase, and Fis domain/tetratricopeptide (TPR) repeat protein